MPLALGLLLLLPACLMDRDPGLVACEDDAHCPSGWRCPGTPEEPGTCVEGAGLGDDDDVLDDDDATDPSDDDDTGDDDDAVDDDDTAAPPDDDDTTPTDDDDDATPTDDDDSIDDDDDIAPDDDDSSPVDDDDTTTDDDDVANDDDSVDDDDDSTPDPCGVDQDSDGVAVCGPDGVDNTGDEDCDDNDEANFPGNAEICDGSDNDCDSDVDVDDASLIGVPGMVCVPQGPFWMGCAPGDTQCDGDGREEPYHEVGLDAFLVDATEVTVLAYGDCLDSGPCTAPNSTVPNCSGNVADRNNWLQPGRDDHPVNCVSWYQAVAYCTWVGGRLPTEAEWEKAARGPAGDIWPWGSAPADCTYAVMDEGGGDGCGTGTTAGVGSKPAGVSPYGALDMVGNLQEWTADWFSTSYYAASPYPNPTGPMTGTGRSAKPGAFSATSGTQRPSWRQSRAPSATSYAVGFRCVDIPGWAPVDSDEDGSPESIDCDDADAESFPGNPEACDGFDNDCDAATEADGGEADGDLDGSLACEDCDDNDPSSTVRAIDADCDGVVDFDLVYLAGGLFDMGCTAAQQADGNCGGNETPEHGVTLTNDFWMSETEVTQAQWQAVIGNSPSFFVSCGLDCPVEQVSWWEAIAFANAMSSAEGMPECYAPSGCTGAPGVDLECTGVTVTSPTGSVYDCPGYRLPTEAEWEYAARSGTDFLYAGSDDLADVGWHGVNSGSTTHAAADLQANAWGLYDMSGNVWEWTWDRYDGTYYSTGPGADPEGPLAGSERVVRGGYFNGSTSSSRVAIRTHPDPGESNSGIGFRIARTVP